MTATRDLIAAALTLADIDEHVAEMPTTAAADVREMCARAISETQPVREVPMPDIHDYGYHDSDNGWVETLACDEAEVRTYGDARESFRPHNCGPAHVIPELGVEVYLFTINSELAAMGFGGRRSKPDFYYTFQDEARRSEHVSQYIEGQRRWAERTTKSCKPVRDADIEALRLYVRALCKAVDAATDFIGTVAGGASWWDDVWADHAAALDRARERISQAALRGR